MVAHDWDALAGCVAADVQRIGPFGDRYAGREEYLKFISELMPSLPGYHMHVSKITDTGHRAFAELSETVEVNGAPHVTPEVLVFDLDDAGLIAHIDIYIKTAGPSLSL